MKFTNYKTSTFLLVALFFSTVWSAVAQQLGGSRRYRLVWIADPATQATLMWESLSSSSAVRKVYYGENDFGQDISKYPNTVTVDSVLSFKGMLNVTARLSKLKAKQIYYVVIEDGGKLSQRFWFKTAPNSNSDRLSFIAGGDSRNNRAVRQNANILVAKLKPTAIFFGGDYTASGTNSEWQEWFDDWQLTISSNSQLFPIVPTRGNHESSNEIVAKLFDAPINNYFATSIGGDLLRLYTLNTESSIAGNQTTWLTQDLNASSAYRWTFAQYHRPMSPHTTSKKEGTAQYKAWAQLFYNKGVDVVFDSDTHLVKSTWPIRPGTGGASDEGFVRDDDHGTVYVGEGGWGAPLRAANDLKSWTRDAASLNHFHWVFVDKNKVEIRVVETENAKDVGQVSSADPFKIPAKLKVWAPKNGAVIEIKH